MKLSELIAAHGDDLVLIQNLDDCFTSISMNKGKSKITFATDMEVSFDGTEKLGLIVWLDRARVAEIVAESKENEDAPDDED